MRTAYVAIIVAATATVAACGSSADTSTNEHASATDTSLCPCPVDLPPVIVPSSTPQPSFVPDAANANQPEERPTTVEQANTTTIATPTPVPTQANTTLPFAPQSTQQAQPMPAPSPTPSASPAACEPMLSAHEADLQCGVWTVNVPAIYQPLSQDGTSAECDTRGALWQWSDSLVPMNDGSGQYRDMSKTFVTKVDPSGPWMIVRTDGGECLYKLTPGD